MRSPDTGPLYLRSQEDFSDERHAACDWDLKDWQYLQDSYDRHITDQKHATLQGARVYLMDDRTAEQILIQKWRRP